jgi:nucleoside-diphosphate-sugar epimerase
VQARWPHQRQLILRPSIIYGPPPPNPIRRGQFLQYIDASLAAQASCCFSTTCSSAIHLQLYAPKLQFAAPNQACLRRLCCVQKPTTFFDDEWRTPTYVADLVAAVAAALALHEQQEGQQGQQQEAQQQQQEQQQRVFNVGGPARMNRVDMALAVAAEKGHDPALVLPGSAASVARTCATPADISMDSSAVQRQLGIRLTPFTEALKQIYGDGGSQ